MTKSVGSGAGTVFNASSLLSIAGLIEMGAIIAVKREVVLKVRVVGVERRVVDRRIGRKIESMY